MALYLEHSPELPLPSSFQRRLQDRLAASRFLTFSILFHVIVITLAGGIIIAHQMIADDFSAPDGGPVEPETIADPPAGTPVFVPVSFAPVAPTLNAPAVAAITTSGLSTTTAPMPLSGVPSLKPSAADPGAHPAPGFGPSSKPLRGLPDCMRGREGGTRPQMMIRNGGKEKSEKAVMQGLRWLKTHQNEDGSWSSGFTPSMTGLAVLCFLGHGEMPESPEFGPTVKKGVDWILKKGTEFRGNLSMAATFSQTGVYEHAIATYALGEYYTMTKDERVKDVYTQAIAHIIDGQAPDGGWQYAYTKGPDSDTSVCGWQIQALKAAHLSGLNLPGVDDSLDKAMLNLKRVNGPNGGFGYRTPADGYTLAGVGVLCTYFWKGDKDKVVRDGIKFIMEETEKKYPVTYKGESCNLYAWYYHTQACLMFGGTAWTKWNKWFQDQVADNQSPDGSWPPTTAKAPGPQADEKGAGPVYRTTLCVLMLEVFYRYMPANK